MTEEMLISRIKKPNQPVDVVLDTDAFNEIDDQFAIAYMLKSELNVKAIFAAPFFNEKAESPADGMEKSYKEILHILSLMGREDLYGLVFKGSNSFLIDEKTPVKSEAVEKLCKLADSYTEENPLYVIAIGAITNIASAILIKPEIINKIVVVWLGGHAHHWPDNNEFNLAHDVAASRIIFGSRVPLVQLPCNGVVSSFTVSEAELKAWLYGKNNLCNYLVENTIKEVTYAVNKPWTRVIWDVTAVAFLTGDFMDSYLTPAPIPEYDNRYSKDPKRHLMRYVYAIDRDKLFNDLVEKLTK